VRRGGAGRGGLNRFRLGRYVSARAGGRAGATAPGARTADRRLLCVAQGPRFWESYALAFFKLLYCIGPSSKCHIALDILRHKTREHMLLGANQGTGDCLVRMKARTDRHRIPYYNIIPDCFYFLKNIKLSFAINFIVIFYRI
jgi:hypothetical protein